MKKRTTKEWVLKLRKDGIRRQFLIWVIPIILKGHHLARNGSGRKKKELKSSDIVERFEKLGDEISNDYRTSHLQGNFPGKNLGD